MNQEQQKYMEESLEQAIERAELAVMNLKDSVMIIDQLRGLPTSGDLQLICYVNTFSDEVDINVDVRGVNRWSEVLPILEYIENMGDGTLFGEVSSFDSAELRCRYFKYMVKDENLHLYVVAYLDKDAACQQVQIGTKPVYKLQCG